MKPIRPQSLRPLVTADSWGFGVRDPATGTIVGRAGPLGRERVVSALRLNDGPQQILPDKVLVDPWGFLLADPDGNVVGRPGVIINRILSARWVHDTRRL